MAEDYLRVTMPDGSQYDVPCHLIAMDRAKYYAEKEAEKEGEKTDKETYNEKLIEEYNFAIKNKDEIQDWASNNMDWDDVKAHAKKVTDNKDVDFQEGWVNGEKEVVHY